MLKVNNEEYFLLSSTCKAVRGISRSLILNYSSGVSTRLTHIDCDLALV